MMELISGSLYKRKSNIKNTRKSEIYMLHKKGNWGWYLVTIESKRPKSTIIQEKNKVAAIINKHFERVYH